MRIGFDITALYVAQAGVFYYDYSLIRALLEQHRENEYLLLDYRPLHGGWTNPPEVQDLEAHRARIVRCQGLRHRRLARWQPMQRPVLRSLASLVDRTLFWPWSAAAGAVMQRKLASVLDGVDVFHSSDVLLWRQPGALNVITVYDLTALLFPEWHTAETRELQQRKYRFIQEEADVVVAISEATKQDLITCLGVLEQRVRVVYGGVSPAFRPIEDREAVARALAPMGLVPGGYILHVGTIEPRKNLVRLVEAYDQVRRMVPPPALKLVLAGTTGWKFRGVFERIGALGLEEEVLFVGRVPAHVLPALYNGAVVFVYPSLYEGFGLPPLEAMACGVPVVVSNAGALLEVVGGAGVVVAPDDVEAMAVAIAELLVDEDKRYRLSEAALHQAKRWTWKQAAQQMLEVYRTPCLRR